MYNKIIKIITFVTNGRSQAIHAGILILPNLDVPVAIIYNNNNIFKKKL